MKYGLVVVSAAMAFVAGTTLRGDAFAENLEGAAMSNRCTEKASPRIDVAGHLAIASRTNMRPLRGVWRWGAIPVGVAVGPDGSVHWSQYRTDTIHRADKEGRGVETIATIDGPLGLALDPTHSRLFFAADRHYPRSIGSLDAGGKPRSLICGADVNRPFAIAVAETSATLYWTESINGRIRVAGTDGARLETLFDDGIASAGEKPGAVAVSPAGIAVDERRGLIFWSDLRAATIVRARLDGSDRKTILGRDAGLVFPTGLALDRAAGKLYWGDPGAETIGRADLDGLEPEVVASAADGVLEPYGLATDGERRLLYWSDVARDAIYRTSLDRKKVERFADLAVESIPASNDAKVATDACGAATVRAQEEFLRRWVKLVRTCVIGVSASKAVMRSQSDVGAGASNCRRQLSLARDVAPLRAALERHCGATRTAAVVDETRELGAEVVAADLPRSAVLLREVRPFVAREEADAKASTAQALAEIDELLERLQRLARRPATTIRWTLPASGQTTSYAAATQGAGGMTAVPDDGALRAGALPAYVDNGDGTIADPSTGLVWEKKCDGCGGLHDVNARYPWRSARGETDVSGWLDAINAEGGTGLAGHGDWRLPEIAELVGIVDYERFNPAIGDAFDGAGCALGCASLRARECSCTRPNAYWTAGSSPRPDDVVPTVAFNLGLVLGQPTAGDAFVRAVRGPAAKREARFVDNGDGTVTDRATRLMWEKKCRCPGNLHDVDRRAYWSFDGKHETIWDWLSAVNEQGGSGFAGYADWRVPNVKELFSLFDGSRRDPSIDPIFAGEGCEDLKKPACSATADGLHWTSTTFADFPSLAVAVGFGRPGELESEPPPGVIRVVGGVEPHEKTLRRVTRAVRGPVPPSP